ncbi:MAG: hypothetical protein PHC41_06760 [Lachnospiraceae bacterium]|jgi:hypothetical protein|nr:hypothetical protein [Lachnospiraceae bacterium]MDD3615914.1 hypothetical protein [Lachnospiraceae bacterium]
MKKVLRYAVIVIIVVGFAFLYAHINKRIAIYDTSVENSRYGNMGEITTDLVVEQNFICERNVLDGVYVKIATFGNVLTSQYDFQILDGETQDVIREGVLDASQVQNGKFHTISFEKIEQTKDKEFIFRISSKDANNGNAITIYNVPKGEEDLTLTLNGEEFPTNTLALKTVSHMFDLETFFVVIFCAAYLIIFVKVLYKFFS